MGLRVLITHPFLYEINGATNVALELAEYLQNRGDKVTVYTNVFDYPIKQYFDAKKIHVDIARSNPKYHLKDFDIVWINSQTFPISLLEELGDAEKIKHAPKFIFMHMSAQDYCADEMPYIYQFEEELSSLSLFVSEEALEFNKKFFEKMPPTDYCRNPAPEEYLIKREKLPKIPRKVLVVSNFPCGELRDIKPLLNRQGIIIDYLGYLGDRYELISEKIISKYDLVITIGKTVQYCLVSGTPVYIYGSFGGPGYLSSKNFQKAMRKNFSGRGFHDKTPEEIVEDIIDNYDKAAAYYTEQQKDFQKTFVISNIIPELFKKAQGAKTKNTVFSKSFIAATKSLLTLVMIDFEQWRNNFQKEALIKENYNLKNENKNLNIIINSRSVQAWLKINKIIKRR
jgi:hypothetical protein